MPPKKGQPKPQRVAKTAYQVMWDGARQRYIALDDAGTLLGLSQTKGLAMGIARTAAINGARERRKTISVVVEDDDGKFKKQWTFAPPGKGLG